jgi:hypothetical protein
MPDADLPIAARATGAGKVTYIYADGRTDQLAVLAETIMVQERCGRRRAGPPRRSLAIDNNHRRAELRRC